MFLGLKDRYNELLEVLPLIFSCFILSLKNSIIFSSDFFFTVISFVFHIK